MIICAALKVNHSDFKPEGYLIIPCWRHSEGYRILYDLVGNKYTQSIITEGFIDNKNNFLNRYDAFNHAIETGQLSAVTRQYKREKHEIMLFSEDLY